jgi:hypothetical protein
MTVAELKQKLNEFDETLEVGGWGHFGECLEIYNVHQSDEGFVILSIESAGDEPE